ncbi:UNVERIFIED_CONTAM: hypothetical protein K2H54_058868, partial [Gekko kuhli]
HPKLNTFISEVIPARSRYGSHTSPNDKEEHKLDTLGHKIYSSGAMGLRVVIFSAVMSLYNCLLWGKLMPYIEVLLQEKQVLAKAIIEEGMRLDTKAKLEELLFKGKELFSDETDDVLEHIQNYKLQAKSFGITAPMANQPKTRTTGHCASDSVLN